LLHVISPPRLRRLVLAALPLLTLTLSADGCSHDAGTGRRVTADTVVATFDPLDVASRTLTLSPRPHGIAGALSWYFDVLDVENHRLAGVKTRWQSSNPAVVTPLFSDVNTRTSDGLRETAVDLRALAAGDAVVTGTVVGAMTKDGLPVTVTLNVHATGPAVSIATISPPVQAGLVDPDPQRRALGRDLVSLAGVAFDAAGERVVGAKLNWACLGDAAGAEFATSVGLGQWSGAGCTTSATDAGGPYVSVRGYRSGTFAFGVSLDGAPEVSALATIVFLDPGSDAGVHLELDPPALAVVVGGQRPISGVLVGADGGRYPAASLTLASHDAAVADSAGTTVTGIASGALPGQAASTTFTASAGPLAAQLDVTVYRPPATVVVTPALTLAPATRGMVAATLVDTDGVTLIPAAATTLTWSTPDPTVATVTATGAGDTATIDALAPGMTAVLVTTGEGVVGTAPLTVGTPDGIGGAGGSGGPNCAALNAPCP